METIKSYRLVPASMNNSLVDLCLLCRIILRNQQLPGWFQLQSINLHSIILMLDLSSVGKSYYGFNDYPVGSNIENAPTAAIVAI